MKLARAIHFDESDMNVFHNPARTGEWCISGGFEFSNWGSSDLTGKAKQAFTNGWLGIETFGRVTFVAVTQIEPSEREVLTNQLAQHFVDVYGAPTLEAARGVAEAEVADMIELCTEQDPNAVLTIMRDLTDAGVKEVISVIESQNASLDQFAVHGDIDMPPHEH